MEHSIRDLCAKFGIPNLPQSPDIWQNSNRGMCNFRSSGQSLINKSCHNSRTGDDIDMKLEPVTKYDKKKKTDVKKIDDEFILANCEVIVIFPNYGQLGATQKPYSGRIVCKTNIF